MNKRRAYLHDARRPDDGSRVEFARTAAARRGGAERAREEEEVARYCNGAKLFLRLSGLSGPPQKFSQNLMSHVYVTIRMPAAILVRSARGI